MSEAASNSPAGNLLTLCVGAMLVLWSTQHRHAPPGDPANRSALPVVSLCAGEPGCAEALADAIGTVLGLAAGCPEFTARLPAIRERGRQLVADSAADPDDRENSLERLSDVETLWRERYRADPRPQTCEDMRERVTFVEGKFLLR